MIEPRFPPADTQSYTAAQAAAVRDRNHLGAMCEEAANSKVRTGDYAKYNNRDCTPKDRLIEAACVWSVVSFAQGESSSSTPHKQWRTASLFDHMCKRRTADESTRLMATCDSDCLQWTPQVKVQAVLIKSNVENGELTLMSASSLTTAPRDSLMSVTVPAGDHGRHNLCWGEAQWPTEKQ